MTQEEKQLLLKDLCARLCYGVKFGIGLGKLGEYDLVEINTKKGKVLFGHGLYTDLETCKPYLRPMSSMTEEEKIELYTRAYAPDEMKTLDEKLHVIQTNAKNAADFYNEHHLDYRGLIPMGLALEAPEGMYRH